MTAQAPAQRKVKPMKTTVITQRGDRNIHPDGDHYVVTGHSTPTTRMTEVELIAHLSEVDLGNPEIQFRAKDGTTIVLSEDARHGQKGWRGSRYENGRWDEWYLFFPTFREAVDVFAQKGEKLEEGMCLAHRRF